MCNTPLLKAVRQYQQRNCSPMHMPGHKGNLPDFLAEVAPYDLTEVTGLDSLFQAETCIADCETEFSRLYGSCATLLSTGGSTLCIQTMLALVAKPGGKVIAGRNIHISAVNAMGLLGINPVWVYPCGDSGQGIPGRISPKDLEIALKAHPDALAVYITTPDYFGVLSPVDELAQLCQRYHVPLLIDNAHGAGLKFLSPSLHPMDLGADMCCDSLHKTLPVLTGGALLHIKNPTFVSQAKAKMSLFGSTSPSYLIMLSMDMCLPYLNTQITQDLVTLTHWVEQMQTLASSVGLSIPTGALDPQKLVFNFSVLGYTKEDFFRVLTESMIEPEYLSESHCVFMPSPFNTVEHLGIIESFLKGIRPIAPSLSPISHFEKAQVAIPLSQAMFGEHEMVSLQDSLGRIAGEICSHCPPGIPLLIPGEIIDEKIRKCLNSYGIFKLNVLK